MNERFVRDNSRKKKEEEEQKGVRKNVNQTNETHLTTLGLTEQERVVAQRSSIPILAGHPSSSHRNTETEPRPNVFPSVFLDTRFPSATAHLSSFSHETGIARELRAP